MATPKRKVVRLLMIGDSNVGKTSLVLRYDENRFSHKFVTTIGVDYRDKVVDIHGANVKLQIWDTAGQERFRALTANFFSRADGIVLAYDVSKRTSFEGVRRWHEQIVEKAAPEVQMLLCGTKCDCSPEEREVSQEDGESLAKELAIPFFETSAKGNRNVAEAFMTLATAVVDAHHDRDNLQSANQKRGVDIFKPEAPTRTEKHCC